MKKSNKKIILWIILSLVIVTALIIGFNLSDFINGFKEGFNSI